MLPVIVKLHIASSAMTSLVASGSPLPLPAYSAALTATTFSTPTETHFYDENEHNGNTLAIWRDGSTDSETSVQVKRLFRCRQTHYERMIAKRTLAMLAATSEHFDSRTIEFASAVRVGRGEGAESPHRAGRAVDFRIRGLNQTDIRDYLWRTFTEVGVGWYPGEQFVHIDSRPKDQDCAWTFFNNDNHYHPYWAEVARRPDKLEKPVKPDHHKPGS